ncbi:hypothetical protein AB0301_04010 [Microbacterium profundi]|uniref:MFS transporter n=1 Tax=Microbacterium profundi TaxID=450380 RepID=A0ABV3LE94_9MICO
MIADVRRTRAGLFAAFAGLGVTASFVPAVLPTAERDVDSDLSVAVPALFAGLLLGVLLSGALLRARPGRQVLMAGSALQALAIGGGASATNAGIFIAAAALAGLGFGLVEASGSIAAKAAVSGSATGLLSALTGTVAVCAAATPLLIAAGTGMPAALSALAVIPVVAIVLLIRAPDAAPAVRVSKPGGRILLRLLPFALALPLYVGVETVISGWSAVIPARALALDPGAAALGTSAFWALMAIGRFGAAALRTRGIRPGLILWISSLGAATLLGCAGALIAPAPGWALVPLAGSVIALAPSYGLVLGLALDRLSTAQSTAATGALVASGAVGGTMIPTSLLLAGHSPASGVTFAASAVLCLLVPALTALGRRRASGTVMASQK